MSRWKKIVELYSEGLNNINIKNDELFDKYGVYPNSINISKQCSCFIIKDIDKNLIVLDGNAYSDFSGNEICIAGKKVKVCKLSVCNSKIIRNIFSFTNPVSMKNHKISLGLGDRLGIASAGHIRLLKDKKVFPILAQQSIRELNLTKRTYENVLADVVWAVLQEGYKYGYGADGDHLKTIEEVKMALDCGYTMITLDCSEYINNDAASLSDDLLLQHYSKIESSEKKYWENKYLDKRFSINSSSIFLSRNKFYRAVLSYKDAIKFAAKIYNDLLKNYEREIDFEISIDETLTSTSPEEHYLFANELKDRNVKIQNLAPRFYGEFQKGIDYRGDINQFEKEFEIHCAIAEHFDYKISLHSGSDKFSIFPIVGLKTKQKFHVKTAGTNWLEALRVIAENNPDLFRKMYQFAIKKLPEAKTFYHIYTEVDMVPAIKTLDDNVLPNLLNIDESRQALHVTYGYLLCEKNNQNEYIFRDEFFDTMYEFEQEYYNTLEKHIGHHLESLGV